MQKAWIASFRCGFSYCFVRVRVRSMCRRMWVDGVPVGGYNLAQIRMDPTTPNCCRFGEILQPFNEKRVSHFLVGTNNTAGNPPSTIGVGVQKSIPTNAAVKSDLFAGCAMTDMVSRVALRMEANGGQQSGNSLHESYLKINPKYLLLLAVVRI